MLYSAFHGVCRKVLKIRFGEISPSGWADTVATYCPSKPSQLLANNRNKNIVTDWMKTAVQ